MGKLCRVPTQDTFEWFIFWKPLKRPLLFMSRSGKKMFNGRKGFSLSNGILNGISVCVFNKCQNLYSGIFFISFLLHNGPKRKINSLINEGNCLKIKNVK
jgi:hypothetical protein